MALEHREYASKRRLCGSDAVQSDAVRGSRRRAESQGAHGALSGHTYSAAPVPSPAPSPSGQTSTSKATDASERPPRMRPCRRSEA